MQENLIARFLKRNNPLKVVLMGIGLWIVLFLVSPLEIKVPISLEPIIFLILNILFLCGGILSINTLKGDRKEKKISRKAFNIAVFFAVICVVLKLIDKLYIRGGTFVESTFANRENYEEKSSNLMAIIASILTGFTYIPLFLDTYINKHSSFFKKIPLYILFFSSIFDIFLIGSRSTTLLSFFIFIYYLLIFNKIKFSIGKIVIYSFLLMLIGLWMGVVFIERSKEFAGEEVISYILTGAGYTEVIGPDDGLINYIKNTDSEFLQTLLVSYTTLINYYIHGVIEFIYVYDKFTSTHTYGQYTFYIYYKFIHIFLGGGLPNFQSIASVNPRPAVYTSFYGPIFFDFGWFSLLFSYLLGLFIKYIYNRASSGFFADTIIYSYLINLLFFLPVFNFIEGAAGLYVISSFILFKIITKFV